MSTDNRTEEQKFDDEEAAGFKGTMTDTVDDPPPGDAPKTNSEPDWKAEAERAQQAAEVAKREADEAKARADKLDQAHRTLQGKYSAEVPRLQKQVEELTQAKSAPAEVDDEAITVLKSEYPVIAAANEAMVAKAVAEQVGRALKPLQDRTEHIEQTVTAVAKSAETTEEERHFQAITNAHPDWQKTIDSKEFNAWIDARPSYEQNAIKAVLDKGTANQVVELLGTFKGNAQQPAPKKDDPPVTAARGRAVPVGLVGEPDKNDEAAGWRLSAQRK